MADLAEISDVEETWRSLKGQETNTALSLLSYGSAKIRVRIEDVDARIAASSDYGEVVRKRLVLAILRYFHDPTRDLFFTRDEWADMEDADGEAGLPQGAFPDVVAYPVY